MKVLPKSVENLIESFEKLPGIGPKSASRLTFYLLHVPQNLIEQFAQSLINLKKLTVFCSNCFNIGETDPCAICASTQRDESTVCVVEQPLDVLSFERIGKYKGVYHVLQGVINPLDNIGPDELKIAQLLDRLKSGKIKEVILATNTNMEGEATAMYIRREILNLKAENAILSELKMTRLAHGLPVGADLEYADEVTLTQSLDGRRDF